MTIYSQRDPRWANKKLGTSPVTIGGYGCLITDLGMFYDKTPDVVNDILTRGGGYANQNLVSWVKACQLLGGKFIWRGYVYDNNAALWAIRKYGAIVIEVDFDGTQRTDDRHWVLFKGRQRMNDPWTGRDESTSKYPILRGFAVISK